MIVRLLLLEGDALLILQDSLLGVREHNLRLDVLRKLLTVSSRLLCFKIIEFVITCERLHHRVPMAGD
jgi:hypothetical protein